MEGTGTSFSSHVNRHLLDAWNVPLCLPATVNNRPTFEEWFEKGCRRAGSVPLQDATIVLTVRKNSGGPKAPHQLLNLQGRGIYMQMLEEDEGRKVWESDNRLLVFVWDSEADLQAAQQPIILKCRITTNKAGPDSQLRGTNESAAPIAGFEAVILDEQQLTALRYSSGVGRRSVQIWSGRRVNFYDFIFPAQQTDSSQVDAGIRPKYQFHVEVERVVFPIDCDIPENPGLLWARETFAVAEKRTSAKLELKPGFHVEPKVRDEMFECLTKVFCVDLEKARVLPFSEMDRFKTGKRVSEHPLHETYIGKESKRDREKFYAQTTLGALVAEIDQALGERVEQRLLPFSGEAVPRVQRVFTMPLDDLLGLWKSAADSLFSHKEEYDRPK